MRQAVYSPTFVTRPTRRTGFGRRAVRQGMDIGVRIHRQRRLAGRPTVMLKGAGHSVRPEGRVERAVGVEADELAARIASDRCDDLAVWLKGHVSMISHRITPQPGTVTVPSEPKDGSGWPSAV